MMKKILILYVYSNHKELVEYSAKLLCERGLQIDLLCVSNYSYHKSTNTRWPYMIGVANTLINKWNLPKMQGVISSIFKKSLFKKLISRYELIDFEGFPNTQYALAEYCIHLGKEYIVSFWGSDILRVDDECKEKMKKSLDGSKYVCLSNNHKKALNDYFMSKYGYDYESKRHATPYGNKDYYLLNSLTEKEIKEIDNIFYCGYHDKRILTIGYNGAAMQNQAQVIRLLSQLPNELKSSLHIVLPMTYGATLERIQTVRSEAESSGISFTILESFLTNKEICVLRKVTDIFVMMEDTDGFSSSVRSHVYCQNVCLIADWLKYPMENVGVYYLKVSWNNLLLNIKDVICNYNYQKSKCVQNSELMRPFMSWDNYIESMMFLYN